MDYTKNMGWVKNNLILMPQFVVFFGYLGRGVFNTLLFIYFIIGFFFLIKGFSKYKSLMSFDKKMVLILWLMTYLIWAFGCFVNGVIDLGYKQWLISFLSSFVMVYVLVFSSASFSADSLSSNFILLGIVVYFSTVLVRIFDCYLGDNCAAASTIDVMSIPIVTPIVGVYFLLWFQSRWFIYFSIFCLFSFLLVYFWDSRTEVLMFLIMMLVNLIYKKREFLKYSIFLLFSPILVVLFFSYVLNSGDAIYQGDVIKFLYDLSTNRFEIWERVFDYPPENVFLGSGINNTMEFLPENNHGSALHNAYLEIWYETGFLGLLSWLLLVVYLAKDYKRMYYALDSEVRDIYGLFFSGFIALIVAGMFDKGYMSNYFQYYIYYYSAMLFVLGRQKSLSE